MWDVILKRYWQVSLFRETPANTPYSPLLLVAIAVCFLVLITTQWIIADVKNEVTLARALFEGTALVLSYVIYTYLLLSIFKKNNRLVQTLSCLFAGHAIVHLCASPLLFAMPILAAEKTNPSLGLVFAVVYLILTLLLTVWQFMLTAYIYKHALEIEYLPAVFASLGLLAANILIISIW